MGSSPHTSFGSVKRTFLQMLLTPFLPYAPIKNTLFKYSQLHKMFHN